MLETTQENERFFSPPFSSSSFPPYLSIAFLFFLFGISKLTRKLRKKKTTVRHLKQQLKEQEEQEEELSLLIQKEKEKTGRWKERAKAYKVCVCVCVCVCDLLSSRFFLFFFLLKSLAKAKMKMAESQQALEEVCVDISLPLSLFLSCIFYISITHNQSASSLDELSLDELQSVITRATHLRFGNLPLKQQHPLLKFCVVCACMYVCMCGMNRDTATQLLAQRIALEQTEADRELCCVCLDKPKDMVFLPCGHICTCEGNSSFFLSFAVSFF